MPAMLELPVLTPTIEILLQVALVVIVVIVAIVLLRQAVRMAVRGILERRAAERDGAMIAPMELERRVNTIARLVLRVGAATIGVMGVLMVLGIFDIDVGPAVAGLGVVGIAVGFGAQTLIRDWLAGVFIVLENQYNEGDLVRIAGVDGVVESFGLRRTTLRDADGTLHTVPNGQITVSSNMTRTRDAGIAGARDEAPLPPSTGASRDGEATDPDGADATAPVGPQR